MPIFSRKKEDKKAQSLSASIKSVPLYGEAIRFLADWNESEYKFVTVPIFAEIYGDSLVEAVMDSPPLTFLSPSSFNVHADFHNLISLPLNSLDVGILPDGTSIVGYRKSVIKRKLADGFVNCMKDLYGLPWKNIQALVHKTRQHPIFLIAEQLTYAIAPISFEVGTVWETGKYDPESKITRKEVVKEVVKIPCHYCGYLAEITLSKCPNCGGAIR